MISIYTDGSAVSFKGKSRGLGGIGVVFVVNGKVKKLIAKGYSNTKVGRMELLAVITALKTLKKNQKANIYSDSMYVVNTFNKAWIFKWCRYGWTCKNEDLMKTLLFEYKKFPSGNINFFHVKGHNGDIFNEMADQLASYKNFKNFTRDLPF